MDSCLSAADEPGVQLYQPAFDAITKANHGSHTPDMLQQAFIEMWRVPFDAVAQKYCFTPAMRDVGWQVLLPLEVTCVFRLIRTPVPVQFGQWSERSDALG